MTKEPGQAELAHQAPESEATYDGLVDLVADSMRHAIGVQRQAHQAVAQLSKTAIAHKDSADGLSKGADKLLRELPAVVANEVGLKFHEAAEAAAETIGQHLVNANESVNSAAKALTKAASELRSVIETDITRRNLIFGAFFAGGSLFGAALVSIFGR
jgi:DNA-binding transcriptional regulator WhiA